MVNSDTQKGFVCADGEKPLQLLVDSYSPHSSRKLKMWLIPLHSNDKRDMQVEM